MLLPAEEAVVPTALGDITMVGLADAAAASGAERTAAVPEAAQEA